MTANELATKLVEWLRKWNVPEDEWHKYGVTPVTTANEEANE